MKKNVGIEMQGKVRSGLGLTLWDPGVTRGATSHLM